MSDVYDGGSYLKTQCFQALRVVREERPSIANWKEYKHLTHNGGVHMGALTNEPRSSGEHLQKNRKMSWKAALILIADVNSVATNSYCL